MAQTIEDVNSRTLLQQFHELYKRQNETETDVENLDTKIDQETIDRQTADLSINSEIQALRDQIDSLGVLFTYKGEVATIQDLPLTDNVLGDVYYVDSEQSGYIWLEKSGVYQWEQFGPAIDLSEYAKQEDLEQLESDVDAMNTQVESNTSNITSLTNTKQDKLTAGTNITIDENNVISASGGGSSSVNVSDIVSNSVSGYFIVSNATTGNAEWSRALYLNRGGVVNIIDAQSSNTRITFSPFDSQVYSQASITFQKTMTDNTQLYAKSGELYKMYNHNYLTEKKIATSDEIPQLYKHTLSVTDNASNTHTLIIISSDSTAYTDLSSTGIDETHIIHAWYNDTTDQRENVVKINISTRAYYDTVDNIINATHTDLSTVNSDTVIKL